jgi:hypothetical protein
MLLFQHFHQKLRAEISIFFGDEIEYVLAMSIGDLSIAWFPFRTYELISSSLSHATFERAS